MAEKNEKIGRRYRIAADTLTYSKTAMGVLVAANIVTGDRLLPKKIRHKSMGAAVMLTGLALLDKADGVLARKAESHGIPITKADKERDPKHDKIYNRIIMGAIATREVVGGLVNRSPERIAVGSLVFANLLATEDRDKRMNRSRQEAVEGADTGAIKLNKYKTGMQHVGHVISASPLGSTGIGQTLVAGAYSLSTYMGEKGYEIADRIHRGDGIISTHLAEVIDINSAREAASPL